MSSDSGSGRIKYEGQTKSPLQTPIALELRHNSAKAVSASSSSLDMRGCCPAAGFFKPSNRLWGKSIYRANALQGDKPLDVLLAKGSQRNGKWSNATLDCHRYFARRGFWNHYCNAPTCVTGFARQVILSSYHCQETLSTEKGRFFDVWLTRRSVNCTVSIACWLLEC